jgi:hypothetical protein
VRFAWFTLLEYVRSWRVLIEVIAALATYFLFLRRGAEPLDSDYFFTVAGVFVAVLVLYASSAVISLGDRPHSYLVLAQGLGRAEYLLGLFLSAFVLAAGSYMLLSALTVLLNRPIDLDFVQWLLGTVPLLLNVGILGGLLLMLSPLVFSAGWRLFVLALIALAFSSNFISGPIFESLFPWLQNLLRAVQSMLGGPLVPIFYGFQLAITRDYSNATAYANLLAQALLMLSLLGLAVYAFVRRDVIFSAT